jgi:hypothetical protein
MTLNHLNLTVVSPDETSAFLAKYFDLEPRGGNAGIQMLSDDKGMVLTLIKARARQSAARPGAVPEQLSHRVHPADQGARGRDQRPPRGGWVSRAAAVDPAWVVDLLLHGARRIHDRGDGLRRAPN